MTISKLSLSFLSIAFAANVFAAEPTSDFINKLKSENEKVNTIVCPFNQEKHFEILENAILSKGTFYYQKDDKVCMSYNDPQGDLLLINGEQFVMITNGKTQSKNAQNKNKFGSLKNLLFACFQGDLNSIGNCSFNYSEDASSYIIDVEMKKKNRILPDKLHLRYDKSNYLLTYMEMEESNGTKTIYKLEGKKINTSIDAGVFHYNK